MDLTTASVLYHHEAELLHAMRWIEAANVPQINTDLGLLCLVPGNSIDRALESVRTDPERKAIEAAFRWYGPAVNIEPAIFNATVDAYELIAEKGVEVVGASFERFRSQYNFESAAGHSHRVAGTLHVLAGDVSTLFASLLAVPADPPT